MNVVTVDSQNAIDKRLFKTDRIAALGPSGRHKLPSSEPDLSVT